MEILLAEMFRVYKKAPIKITCIWLLDIWETLMIISNPYIIGNCIDGLIKKEFFWLVILIVTEVAFWLSHTVNKFFDTRIYSHIIEEEHNAYYSKIVGTEADSSLINARLELVDSIPNFLEIDLLQILNMISGIAVSLWFLFLNSTLLVFLLAIVNSVLIPCITYRFQKRIVRNNKDYKNLEEEQMIKIASRDKLIYGQYIKNILKIEISSSDLDAKIFFVTYCLQMLLLFFQFYLLPMQATLREACCIQLCLMLEC